MSSWPRDMGTRTPEGCSMLGKGPASDIGPRQDDGASTHSVPSGAARSPGERAQGVHLVPELHPAGSQTWSQFTGGTDGAAGDRHHAQQRAKRSMPEPPSPNLRLPLLSHWAGVSSPLSPGPQCLTTQVSWQGLGRTASTSPQGQCILQKRLRCRLWSPHHIMNHSALAHHSPTPASGTPHQ